MADGAAVASLLLGLPVELLRVAPQAQGGLLRQGCELDGLGRAAGPDRMRGVGLLCQGQQARQEPLVRYGHGHASSVGRGPPSGAPAGQSIPVASTGLANSALTGQIEVTSVNLIPVR